MKVYLYSLSLVLIIGLVLFLSFGSFISSDTGKTGFLTIQTFPTGQIVSVNGEVLGTTPLIKSKTVIGEANILIGEDWQETVTISEGIETQVYRDLSDVRDLSMGTYGYSVESQEIGSFIFKESELIVAAFPVGAKISVNDQIFEQNPMVLKDVTPGSYSISVSNQAYDQSNIQVEVKENMLTRVDVSLKPNPYGSIESIGLPVLDNQGESNLFDPEMFVSRLDWKGTRVPLEKDSRESVLWDKIELWGLEIADDLDEDYIREIDKLYPFRVLGSNNSSQINAVPFAFIVDPTGKIYEGLGIFDFDFESIVVPPKLKRIDDLGIFKKGVAPVLVITNDLKDVFSSEKVKNSVYHLKQLIEEGPSIVLSPVTQLDTISIPFGEDRVIDLEWENESSGFIDKQEDSLWLISKEGSDSKIQDASSWKSVDQIVTFNEDRVAPGEIVTFTLPIHVNYYPEIVTEHLFIQNLVTGQVIPGSEISLKISISGETENTLEIVNPPNGFIKVFEEPNQSSNLISVVYSNDRYAWTREVENWVEIVMRDGQKGWINDKYIVR